MAVMHYVYMYVAFECLRGWVIQLFLHAHCVHIGAAAFKPLTTFISVPIILQDSTPIAFIRHHI